MPQYLLESSHTPEECLRSIPAIMEYRTQILNHSWFGCGAGVHCGWVEVEADNEAQARYVLPPHIRSGARVIEVHRYTADEIKGYHKKV